MCSINNKLPATGLFPRSRERDHLISFVSIVSLAYVNRITKGREQIVNKTFVKMMDELGYDVELTYKKMAGE
jgi:hypothetical protein